MAKQKAMGFKEFRERFNNEEICREYMFTIRWPNGFVCPKCGCVEYYTIATRNKFQCKGCRHQTSVTAGTVMDRSHLTLQTWFWAFYMVARDKRGCSAMQLSNELELPYNTAWFLLHRIHYTMA